MTGVIREASLSPRKLLMTTVTAQVLLCTRQGLLNGRLLQASLIIVGMHCAWLLYSVLTPLPVRI